MSLKITQSSKYIGNKYWSWSVWINGSDAELDAIKRVVWYLHPSFSPPMVKITDRSSCFKLETSGWGTFEIEATLEMRSGVDLSLSHELELFYPDDEATTRSTAPKRSLDKSAPPPNRQVFLSYSASDVKLVSELRSELQNLSMAFVDSQSVTSGLPMERGIQRQIETSMGTVVLQTESELTQFMKSEVQTSISYSKPILIVGQGGAMRNLPSDISRFTMLEVDFSQPSTVALAIQGWLNNLKPDQSKR
jgi:YEATS family